VLALVGVCVVAAWAGGAPLVQEAAGRAGGRDAWAVAFLVALAGAFAAYVVALRLLPASRVRLAAVLAVAAAIQLLPLGAPLLLSTDAWTYWEYGAIANDGGDPYRETPAQHPENPAFEHAGADWRGTTSVYGPAFSLGSQVVAHAVGSSEDGAAWVFKVIAALSILALTALAARLATERRFAAAFVGWNPVLAIHFAGGGHNDALMMALVLGALACAAAGRRRAAAVLWPLAILIKWIPLVFFALRVLDARASGRRVAHGVFAATAAVVLALATWQYGWGWLRASGPLADNAGEQTSYAFPHRLEQLGLPHGLTLGLAAAVLTAGLVLLAREALRGRPHLARAGCLLIVVTPWLTPWYLVWAVPLAAAEEDRKAQLFSLALCAYLLPQTIV
jgi:Glycosyltransferase family 87